MQIGLNTYTPKASSNSISFQSGELNNKFAKRLLKAKTNGSDAQALLHTVDEDLITFSEERFEQVKKALDETKVPSAKYYLNLLVDTWKEFTKN